MGKRTSDFVALATVLGGVGVGFGLTSLFARSAPVALVDDVSVHDVSVKVRIVPGLVPGRVLVRDGYATSTIYFGSQAGANELRWSTSGEVIAMQDLRLELEARGEALRVEVRGMERAGRVELERAVAELSGRRIELEREAQELFEEALEELDCLGAAVRGDEDEDQRRRRRRRRPCR